MLTARQMIYRVDDAADILAAGTANDMADVLGVVAAELAGTPLGDEARRLSHLADQLTGGPRWRLDQLWLQVQNLRRQLACWAAGGGGGEPLASGAPTR